jgi:hypothetical protein
MKGGHLRSLSDKRNPDFENDKRHALQNRECKREDENI